MTNSELSIPTPSTSLLFVIFQTFIIILSPLANEIYVFSNSLSSLTSSDMTTTLLIHFVDIYGQDFAESLRCVWTITNWQKIMAFLFCPPFLIILNIRPFCDTYWGFDLPLLELEYNLEYNHFLIISVVHLCTWELCNNVIFSLFSFFFFSSSTGIFIHHVLRCFSQLKAEDDIFWCFRMRLHLL